ncbi:uncharacterized protein ACN63O_016503 [Diretmus argenteus]
MNTPKAADVKRGISVLWETLQCPICLDIMSTPVSTKCDHQFCKLCMLKVLDSTKQKEAKCPVCKAKITKRGLQESLGFQRLVSGLQDMIQAYEQDTGTNSQHGFAGLMDLEDSNPFILDNEGVDSGLGDAPPTSVENTHSPIEIEISQVVEKTTSQHKIRGKKRIALFENPSSHPILIPDEDQHQPLRRSSRNNKKKDLEPDKILGQRQKKSLEKVTEWLTKVPPAGENFEFEKLTEDTFDSECSAGPGNCSSTSTVEVIQDDIDVNPKRKEPARALEDQVFGAVYKRDRRSIRAVSPQPRVFVDPPTHSLSEKTQTPKKTSKRRKNNNSLTPADFVKKSRSEDKNESPSEEQPQMIEQVNNAANNILQETEQTVIDLNDSLNITDNEESNRLPENDSSEGKGEADSPVFNIGLHQEKKSKKRRCKTWQHVDDDLQEQPKAKLASVAKKRTGKKKGKNGRLDKGKSAKVLKPLVLVSVQEEDDNPVEISKARQTSEAVQVQIENYPSSEDRGTLAMRRSTRSRRLELFTEQVQGRPEKASASKNIEDNTPGEDANVVKQPEEANASTSDDMACRENGNISKLTQRNGCIFDEDIGGIEKMEYSESSSGHLRTTEADTVVKESVADVPNAETPHEDSAACYVPIVPSCSGPTEATVLNPALENVIAANPSPNNALLENVQTSACQSQFVEREQEEDKTDSELDTEQLLKSFKATKRKSFHFGCPNMKGSHVCSDKENLQATNAEDNCHVGSTIKSATNQDFMNAKEGSFIHQEVLREIENSSCSDLIPPSRSPRHNAHKLGLKRELGLKKPAKTDQSVVDNSMPDASGPIQDSAVNCHSSSSVSSGLSPNKVTKHQTESPHCSVGPQSNSGLLFPAFGLSEEEMLNNTPASPMTEKQLDCRELKQINTGHALSLNNAPATEKSCKDNTIEHMVSTEGSLTPDGLVPPVVQMVHDEIADGQGSGELSAHSPIKNRTRRRAQQLDSSESDCSDGGQEELPTLAQIFRTSAVEQESSCLLDDHAQDGGGSNTADGGEGACGKADAAWGRPPACPSPDCVHSSQASVDLFATPDDCHVPVNESGVSIELSSEVLVTQQKIAMQEELVRLEKLIGLVSEVLQEKEGSPAANVPSVIPLSHQSTKCTDHDDHMPLSCDQSTSRSSGREAAPDAGRDHTTVTPGSAACGGSGATQPSLPNQDGIAEMDEQHTTHTAPSVRRSGATKTSSSVSGVKPVNKMLNNNSGSPSAGQEINVQATSTTSAHTPQRDRSRAKLVLVSSGLGSNEQVMVKKFAKKVGGRVVSQVTAEVTHIIMRTDGQLVCERTLKYFLGIAGRKWVVSFQWISECFKQGKLLDESPFEVRGDVVNGPDHQGPMRARTTDDMNLLMKGYTICFQGLFMDMTTDQMEWMVELCGAAVVKDPLLLDSKPKSHQLVIVQPGSDSSQSKYRALSRRAAVVTRGWLLDTVATYTLQNHNDYRT